MNEKLTKLTTEQQNPNSKDLDNMSFMEIITLMNNEDQTVVDAVKSALPQIEEAVKGVFQSVKGGGRLLYAGAGTSGRIGVMDAVECPPTFGTEPDQIQAVIAGGYEAIHTAVEGAEDDMECGAEDLRTAKLSEKDVVVGIAASGRTPYVAGALEYAGNLGACTVALSSNANALISDYADHPIEVIVGPEILTASTRLKAATAHKMILNMLSTAAMVRLGKVYENLMVDLKVSNYKLAERAKHILMKITGADYETADRILTQSNYEVKPAIVMIEANVSYESGKEAIKKADGFVRKAIEIAKEKQLT